MKILLACGGTGGHIFPAFSVAEEIKRRFSNADIVYVCGKKDIEQVIFAPVTGEKVAVIESAAFEGAASLWSPAFLIKSCRGFAGAAKVLSHERPDVVVGFGGHLSFPVVAAARLMNIPTLVHEQNVVPGLATRILSRIAGGTAVSFEETRRYLPRAGNLRFTGNPIRASIERDCRDEAREFFGFEPHKRTLLVLGGSQGAESINSVFLSCLKHLDPGVRGMLQVLHLCGKMSPADAQARCRAGGVQAKCYSFFDRMDLAYGAADLALGRAGATFLAEIHAKNIPAVLVPYPYGNGHQLVNARVFGLTHDVKILPQSELSPERLAAALEDYLKKILPADPPPALGRDAGAARIHLTDFILESARCER